ncbi:MAG: hypothetical protein GW823_07265 [Bacteroidetes bacterium]|nr:hypothetical protein [Bacteroidota bacterium]
MSPHYDALSDSLANVLHKESFNVVPWTVNSVEVMERMISYNVDGIITE